MGGERTDVYHLTLPFLPTAGTSPRTEGTFVDRGTDGDVTPGLLSVPNPPRLSPLVRSFSFIVPPHGISDPVPYLVPSTSGAGPSQTLRETDDTFYVLVPLGRSTTLSPTRVSGPGSATSQ